jgi:hypothetical protein
MMKAKLKRNTMIHTLCLFTQVISKIQPIMSELNNKFFLRFTRRTLSLLLSVLLTSFYGCTQEQIANSEANTVERNTPTNMIVSRDQNVMNFDLANLPDMTTDLNTSRPAFNKIRARFEWQGDDFYRMPWPSDARLTAQGMLDLSDFPGDTPILTSIREYLQSSIKGFSLMPVIYIPFLDELQEEWLPSITESTAIDSPIQLIDLTPQNCGRRIPIESQISTAKDDYLQEHVLQIRNTWGTMLTPGQPHALIVLSTFGDDQHIIESPEEFQMAWQSDTHETSVSLQALKDCLPNLGLQKEHIAIATVFTPQDPRQKLLALHQYVTDADQVPSRAVNNWHQSEGWSRRRISVKTMQGSLPMPIFQTGDMPYEESGGTILLDDEGIPIIQRWENVPVAVSFKEGDRFDEPRPILVFIDGTGWSQWKHIRSTWIYEAMNLGYVIYSFMPQFHGKRAGFTGNDMLATFNLLNPAAGGNNFIQQTAEISYFARAIREQLVTVEGLPSINTDTMLYAAQSQGSLCGAMHASVSDQFASYVLNGVSSSITLTMLYRDDLLNFRTVMSGFLQTTPDALDLFHPALQLIQLGSDAVDPNSYAPYWQGWSGQPKGNHVFVINGQEDQTTRPLGMANLTMVSQASPLAPLGWEIDPYNVAQVPVLNWPITGNHQSFSQTPLTLASFLSESSGHYTIYSNSRLRKVVHHFWESSREGVPTLKSIEELHCDDGLDDDQDGQIDCEDPDCTQRKACQESDCDDGLDNDGDELIDCEDSSCSSSVPCTELCANEEDDNGDDLIDCEDPICAQKDRCQESRCNDRNDGDDDGLTDCEDDDCYGSLHCPELLCDDGVDQNNNGVVDCDDIGCSWSDACRSAYESECDDGLDEDEDTLIDCEDPDCASQMNCAMIDACWQVNLGDQLGFMLYQGYLDMMSNRYRPGDCTSLGSGEGSQDFAFLWTAPQEGRYQISTYGSELDTVLQVYHPTLDENCEVANEIACNDDQSPVSSSRVIYEASAGEEIMIVVSAYDVEEASELFYLHINQVIEE